MGGRPPPSRISLMPAIRTADVSLFARTMAEPMGGLTQDDGAQ